MFVWFSYPEKTWRRCVLFATIAPCAHIARLFNDVGKFSMFKINLSYFPSRARLNFRWIFKEFDLKSNMKGFFENFLALSVKKLKKVLMILSSITGRGRAFLAESCRYMPCLAIRRWNFHAKVANPKVNSQKVYHDDRSTLVGECYKLSRDENAKALCKRTRLYRLYNSIQHQTCVCTPFQVPYYTQLNKSDAV